MIDVVLAAVTDYLRIDLLVFIYLLLSSKNLEADNTICKCDIEFLTLLLSVDNLSKFVGFYVEKILDKAIVEVSLKRLELLAACLGVHLYCPAIEL